MRNLEMAERIGATASRDRVGFAFAGDSGAWPDPTADAIFAQLARQVAALDPPPAFFANLGDFAGPGTIERHERYVRVVEDLPFPDICVVGNHDLDDPGGREAWARIHGPANFAFACGHTRFVALDAAPGDVGDMVVGDDPEGPDEEALAFLDRTLEAAAEPNRVVLMHMPPSLGGRFEPHPDWGFRRHEGEFLALLHRHRVRIVCAAHGLAFDHTVRDGVHFVMSGGGGTGLCSHIRGICAEGEGNPEDRGGLFHAVHVTIDESGTVEGRVLQAFDPDPRNARITFGS
jgi:Calcineurin-like phosphoesterase